MENEITRSDLSRNYYSQYINLEILFKIILLFVLNQRLSSSDHISFILDCTAVRVPATEVDSRSR